MSAESAVAMIAAYLAGQALVFAAVPTSGASSSAGPAPAFSNLSPV
jgi:hypothetical protein